MFKPAILSLGAILLASMMGCNNLGQGNDEIGPEKDGVYVYCQGDGQQYAQWYGNWAVSAITEPGLETCIGIPNVSGADDAQFTFEEWDSLTNTFPAYHEQIASMCETKCWKLNENLGDGTENPLGVCGAAGFTEHVAGLAWDPGDGYNCYTEWADEGTITDPYASTIDWGGGGSPLSLPLACSLLDECYMEFDGNIGIWTQAWEYGGEFGPIAPMERGADYYATALTTTVLSLDMDAGTGAGYDDTELLEGYAEYSASACGESTCPFYLASFSASNDTDVWDVWVNLSGVFSEPKHIENVQIDALQSSLGAWRPSTGQVAFLPGTLSFGVSFDVSSDCGSSCTGLGDDHYDLVLRNDQVVFGEFSAGGFVLEQAFSVVGGNATLEMDLGVEEGPPSAAMGLSAQVECNDARGYVLSASDSASTDPDNDIEFEMWIVDGAAVPNTTTLEVGMYNVALGVVDERGAWDFTDEQEIEVISGSACI
ncbi:hypothetical protein ACNOYE_08935 [Nannocystaceae bacterium ST9]